MLWRDSLRLDAADAYFSRHCVLTKFCPIIFLPTTSPSPPISFSPARFSSPHLHFVPLYFTFGPFLNFSPYLSNFCVLFCNLVRYILSLVTVPYFTLRFHGFCCFCTISKWHWHQLRVWVFSGTQDNPGTLSTPSLYYSSPLFVCDINLVMHVLGVTNLGCIIDRAWVLFGTLCILKDTRGNAWLNSLMMKLKIKT